MNPSQPHNYLAELFGGADLLVYPQAFRAWLAEATVKSASLASADVVAAAVQAYDQREVGPKMIGDVAVIDMRGPITYKSSWLSYYFGGASIEDMQAKFRVALQDPAVRTILFRGDTPGGTVTMVPEFADEIFAARGVKTIAGVADTLVASAGYWLFASVETIYTSVSGCLGSIGVYTEHLDISQMLEKAGVKVTLIAHGDHKVDGNPYEPLSEEVKARVQARVDEVGSEFEAAVARGPGVKKKLLVDKFCQGDFLRSLL
jgi:ClpP class serine protease